MPRFNPTLLSDVELSLKCSCETLTPPFTPKCTSCAFAVNNKKSDATKIAVFFIIVFFRTGLTFFINDCKLHHQQKSYLFLCSGFCSLASPTTALNVI